ncbi:MAG: PD40 domain-containing protein [Elusimicrobia bacterium]|nr:PD40 domain-containing protein [Elusimicrobiota bacterium]
MSPALLLATLLTVPADAQTEVRMSVGGGSQPLPVLVLPAFSAADGRRGEDAALAGLLREIVRRDLLLSRRFDVRDEDSGGLPAAWRLLARAGQAADKISAQVTLADASGGRTVFERYYRQDARWPRALAHRVADDVVKAATGRDGFARTRIAFVNDQTGRKEIYLMDYDGENVRRLTDDRSIDLLPRVSPDGRFVAYTSYKDGNPDLFLLDLRSGRTSALSAEQGLNVAGGFSPDGTKLLMTLSRGRSPNLYLKDLKTGGVERLTSHFGADSTPTFSPDARQAAFVSDRAGNPQIYVLDLETRQPRRLTNFNWCDAPAWSPTGEWIAFAGRARRGDPLDIFLADVTGSQVLRLTRGEGANEDPAWSPDGRLLAFSSTREGRPRIYVMDADGSAPRRAAELPGASTTPFWSAD